VLAIQLLDLTAAALCLAAGWRLLWIVPHWRPERNDAGQLKRERSLSLVVYQGRWILGLQVVALAALVMGVSNAWVAHVPGAMCGTGVLQALGPAGRQTLLLRLLTLLLLYGWQVVAGIDDQRPDMPLAPVHGRWLLLVAPLLVLSAWRFHQAMGAVASQAPVSCCAALYAQAASSVRFGAAVRELRGQLREGGAERAFMAAALEDAIARLKAQERATAARAEASERLSDEIVSGLASGLVVVALDRAVRIVNPAGRRLLQLGPETALTDYRDLLAGAPGLAAAIDECLTSGRAIVRRPVEVAVEGRAAQHFGVTVSPLLDEGGRLHGAVCLFSDLTDVVSLEEQLRVKDSLARLGELTAGLAHEFRNGLATIHGYGRLLDPADLPERARPFLEGIRQETDALAAIVTNFLAFARPAELTMTPVDVQAVVARAASDLAHEAAEHGGQIEVRGTFGTIDGDEVLLRQAFSNLVRNGVEAAVEAGTVPAVVVEGHADAGTGTTIVEVHDNGRGVDPTLVERVFLPFFSTKGRGTGLGLAMVRKIVVTHNGRVAVAPSRFGGACFKVVLPLRAAP
jgi:signal transduction histidine kinase